ncbi:hypothetical protein ABLG96_20305 [Nakamurella sp. A5-74]|uniref:Uncharacterized protein n=1 Tax=Nakamurella sp. A5-74 TaxID=3158264 RepID=A0AAU8DP28_9ACTN
MSAPASQAGSPADVARVYGSVPIPTAPSAQPIASASEGHPTILEMGAPVRVSLPGSVRAVVTALGPVELTPAPGTPSTPGIITVDVVTEQGTLTVAAGDFSSRDETGRVVTLQPRSARSVTATPGHPARVVVRGTYDGGAAQVTWRHDGRVVAVWDFNIELD